MNKNNCPVTDEDVKEYMDFANATLAKFVEAGTITREKKEAIIEEYDDFFAMSADVDSVGDPVCRAVFAGMSPDLAALFLCDLQAECRERESIDWDDDAGKYEVYYGCAEYGVGYPDGLEEIRDDNKQYIEKMAAKIRENAKKDLDEYFSSTSVTGSFMMSPDMFPVLVHEYLPAMYHLQALWFDETGKILMPGYRNPLAQSPSRPKTLEERDCLVVFKVKSADGRYHLTVKEYPAPKYVVLENDSETYEIGISEKMSLQQAQSRLAENVRENISSDFWTYAGADILACDFEGEDDDGVRVSITGHAASVFDPAEEVDRHWQIEKIN